MTSSTVEDLLQAGHVVKERWKVVRWQSSCYSKTLTLVTVISFRLAYRVPHFIFYLSGTIYTVFLITITVDSISVTIQFSSKNSKLFIITWQKVYDCYIWDLLFLLQILHILDNVHLICMYKSF